MIKKIIGYFAIGAMALAVAFGGAAASSLVTAKPAQAAYTSSSCYSQRVQVTVVGSGAKRVEYWKFCWQNHDVWANQVLGWKDGWYLKKYGHGSYLDQWVYYGTARPGTTLYVYSHS